MWIYHRHEHAVVHVRPPPVVLPVEAVSRLGPPVHLQQQQQQRLSGRAAPLPMCSRPRELRLPRARALVHVHLGRGRPTLPVPTQRPPVPVPVPAAQRPGTLRHAQPTRVRVRRTRRRCVPGPRATRVHVRSTMPMRRPLSCRRPRLRLPAPRHGGVPRHAVVPARVPLSRHRRDQRTLRGRRTRVHRRSVRVSLSTTHTTGRKSTLCVIYSIKSPARNTRTAATNVTPAGM